jgi:hypothetical protein
MRPRGRDPFLVAVAVFAAAEVFATVAGAIAVVNPTLS